MYKNSNSPIRLGDRGASRLVKRPPRLSRIRYSLRTLLWASTVVAIVTGWQIRNKIVHEKAIGLLDEQGAILSDRWVDPPGPNWLYTGKHSEDAGLPNDYFSPWFENTFCTWGANWCWFKQVEFRRAHLSALTKLKRLPILTISSTNLNGCDLKGLSRISGLVELSIASHAIDDLDIPYLSELKRLRKLTIQSRISETGLDRLRTTLPNCDIVVVPLVSNAAVDFHDE